jgi:tRNA(Ile)-lysidine synthase
MKLMKDNKMFLEITQLPNKKEPFILACSGGVDSMAGADFLRRGGFNFTLAYFNHKTPQALEFEQQVRRFGKENNIPVVIGYLSKELPKGSSQEHFWRDERYRWLESYGQTIVTCHHLDDAVEGWIFSSLHGEGKVIPYRRPGVLRPFLLNTKVDMMQWCRQHQVTWVEDVSNAEMVHARNRIRHSIIPECKLINPGLNKVIKKKILEQVKGQKNEDEIKNT